MGDIFVWKITGVSSLLQNSTASMFKPKDDGLKGGKTKYVDEDEAEIRINRNESGEVTLPSQAFRAGMQRAGSGRKIGKLTARQVVSGGVFPQEEHIVLHDAKGKSFKSCSSIDKRRVVVGTSGVPRCRPRFDNWQCKLAMEIDTLLVKVEVITELLNLAGKIAGIGDFRPEKGGTFGRYTAELETK